MPDRKPLKAVVTIRVPQPKGATEEELEAIRKDLLQIDSVKAVEFVEMSESERLALEANWRRLWDWLLSRRETHE